VTNYVKLRSQEPGHAAVAFGGALPPLNIRSHNLSHSSTDLYHTCARDRASLVRPPHHRPVPLSFIPHSPQLAPALPSSRVSLLTLDFFFPIICEMNVRGWQPFADLGLHGTGSCRLVCRDRRLGEIKWRPIWADVAETDVRNVRRPYGEGESERANERR